MAERQGERREKYVISELFERQLRARGYQMMQIWFYEIMTRYMYEVFDSSKSINASPEGLTSTFVQQQSMPIYFVCLTLL